MRSKPKGKGAEAPTASGHARGETRFSNNLLDVPILPLAGSVVLPGSIHPLSLRGEQAAALLEAAGNEGGLVALFLQKPTSTGDPTGTDLYTVGTLASLSPQRQDSVEAMDVEAQGIGPVRLAQVSQWDPYVRAAVQVVQDEPAGAAAKRLANKVRSAYRALIASDPAASVTLMPVLEDTSDPVQLAFLVAATIPIGAAERQAVLEAEGVEERLRKVAALMAQLRPAGGADQVHGANGERDESLAPPAPRSLPPSGAHADRATAGLADFTLRLEAAGLPPKAERAAQQELERLAGLSPSSPDYAILHDYLEWLASLTWRSEDEPPVDLKHASEVLDAEHYGLLDVKDRILDHLAVRKLRQDRSAGPPPADSEPVPIKREPVLCLVGPPGIGKTSLGRSIASALGRPFARISLGGVSDEAEIRGHRRTYVGAMPGTIIRSLVRLGSNHPVIMLDEMDKLGRDGKGDPAAALLEVLDTEQQPGFVDHYLDVPFDLSNVLFVATANTLEAVSPALRDRLEVIQLSGYTEEEKVQIAVRHLIPAQMEWHALTEQDLVWEPEAIASIVRNYTREAGVRQLEREIATVCRRTAGMVAQSEVVKATPQVAGPELIAEILGPPRFLPERPEATEQPGVVTGVVWTPVGGDVIHVEAGMMPGHKTLTITGQLGEIMRESAMAALSYVRSRAESLGVDPSFYEHNDIHLHVPSGSVQKDGPSAGITLATALVSLLTGVAVPPDVAMSGEITLRGRVLPVGGIKEKVLGARRSGITTLILPAGNSRDLEQLPANTLDDLGIVTAETMEDVLEAALPGSSKRGAARRTHTHRSRVTSGEQSADIAHAARSR
ncbi:MAG: endopeptidase La [Chloroflexia bacterium]